MKTLLVALNSKYSHSNIAVRYLKNFCADFDVEIYESNINIPYQNTLKSIADYDFDIVGFSCYIFNIDIIKKLASDIKKIKPTCKIIFGGPEVSYDYEEFLPLCDYLISGEGEVAFREILTAEGSGENLTDGKTKVISRPPLAMEYLPTLITEEYLNYCIDKIFYYESSRGCPYKCSYCISSLSKGYRTFPDKRLFEELTVLSKANIKTVKFVDRTFNANIDRATGIFRFLIENPSPVTFHFEMAGDLIDDKMLKVLFSAKAGHFQFEIGLQSFNSDTLKAVRRAINTEKTYENIKKVIALGNIHTHIDLISALPMENYLSFIKSFNTAYSLKPHCLQLGFLKMLRGSQIRNESEKYGYVYSSFAPYEVISTNFISYNELTKLKACEKALDYYYNDRTFAATLNLLTKHFPSPYEMFYNLGKFLNSCAGNKSIGLYEKLNILYNFAIKYSPSEEAESCIRFDYLVSNNEMVIKKPLTSMLVKSDDPQIFIQVFPFDPITQQTKRVTIAFDYHSYNPVAGTYAYRLL